MLRRLIKWVLLIAFLILILRVFVFQIKTIDNFNMSSTILPGDRVLIDKLSNGIRFPNSILGLPGVDQPYIDWFRIRAFRLPSWRKFRNGDIVVFNDPSIVDKPIDRKQIIISRIAGLPSDTLIILDKNLYINGDMISPPSTIRREYRVVTDGSEIPVDFLSEYNIKEAVKIPEVPMWDLDMDTIAYTALKEKPFVRNIRQKKMYVNDPSSDFWPYSSFHIWNRDQFGPLIIPYSNQTIEINLKNIDRYKEIIEIFEGNDLRIDFSGVFINGKPAKTYTFKKDYYFVLDDNRDDPSDSRIIGFIPKNHILGQVRRIAFSGGSDFENLSQFRLKRLLKHLR